MYSPGLPVCFSPIKLHPSTSRGENRRQCGDWVEFGSPPSGTGHACSMHQGIPPITAIITDVQAVAISKMKVHPGILMKTKKSRFRALGVRGCVPRLRCRMLPAWCRV